MLQTGATKESGLVGRGIVDEMAGTIGGRAEERRPVLEHIDDGAPAATRGAATNATGDDSVRAMDLAHVDRPHCREDTNDIGL